MQGFPDDVSLSASDWPQSCREPRPGDLHVFIPQGFGLGAPAIGRMAGLRSRAITASISRRRIRCSMDR